VTGAQIAARAARQDAVLPTATGRQRLAELAFRALLLGAVGVGVLALGVLLYDVAADGLPKLSTDFLTRFPSRIIPANSGVQSALVGTLYLMVITTAGGTA
jgi:phosphate transport system permease protein